MSISIETQVIALLDEAQREGRCCSPESRSLREAMRHVSVPAPDWGAASEALRWAATLCMELARDCEIERMRDGD